MTTGQSTHDTDQQVDLTPSDDRVDDRSKTRQVTDQAKQTAGRAADQAKQATSDVADRARATATSQANTRMDQAAQGLSAVAHAFTQVGDQLRQNDQGMFAQAADTAASGVNRAAGYLRQRDANDLLADVEDLARRQPALFLGGAFLAGIFAARFLKSTSSATRPSSAQQWSAASAREWDRSTPRDTWTDAGRDSYRSDRQLYEERSPDIVTRETPS